MKTVFTRTVLNESAVKVKNPSTPAGVKMVAFDWCEKKLGCPHLRNADCGCGHFEPGYDRKQPGDLCAKRPHPRFFGELRPGLRRINCSFSQTSVMRFFMYLLIDRPVISID